MGHQATNPSAHPHEPDTLDSLRQELIQFAYQTECRLETLYEQISQQARDTVSRAQERNQPEEIPAAVPTPAAGDSTGEDQSAHPRPKPSQKPEPPEANLVADNPVGEASKQTTGPDEVSDSFERLAAIKRRIELQLAKEAN